MPEPISRRSALRTFAVAAAATVAAPVALAALTAAPANAATLLWHPNPATDGLNAFEGIEADRVHKHPDRKYVVVEGGDHYRLNIWADDRDTPAAVTGSAPNPRAWCRAARSRRCTTARPG
jgi:hypothetical protein